MITIKASGSLPHPDEITANKKLQAKIESNLPAGAVFIGATKTMKGNEGRNRTNYGRVKVTFELYGQTKSFNISAHVGGTAFREVQ